MTSPTHGTFPASDRFVSVRQLGIGGMGIVYEAIDRQTGQRVGLKTLHKVDPNTLYRFKQEFRSLSQIAHTNLVPLYELISDGDRWFFTMELVDDALDFLAFARSWPIQKTGRTVVPTRSMARDSGSFSLGAISGVDDEVQGRDVQGRGVSESSVHDRETEVQVDADCGPPTSECTVPLSETQSRDTNSKSSHQSDQTVALEPSAGRDGVFDGPEASPRASPDRSPSIPATDSRPASLRPASLVLDWDTLRNAFGQLCRGVHKLHQSGILHRDLKPGNVLVNGRGTVVVLDFGLAAELRPSALERSLEEASDDEREDSEPDRNLHWSTHSSNNRIEGTISYMSPEQASAQPLSEASDWYSVGVMLFKVITGRKPIEGSPRKVFARKRRRDAPRLSTLVGGVPDDIDHLCRRMLDRDPSKRPTYTELVSVFRIDTEEAEDADFDRNVPTEANIPFVGRGEHLRTLDDAFAQSRRGETVVYRVHGRSGAGKSSLIEHFLRRLKAAGKAKVLVGRCYEQETVPFKGIDTLVDDLARLLKSLPEEEGAELMPREISAMATIFPVIRRVNAIDRVCRSAAGSANLVEQRDAAFRAIRDLIVGVSDRFPIVLYIDDLQWGDIDSARLLQQILSGDGAPRLLAILSYRSEYEEASPCLNELLRGGSAGASTAVAGRWRELTVDAMTTAECEALAVALLDPTGVDVQEYSSQIVRQSAGSAYLTIELARHVNQGGDLDSIGTDLDQVLWRRTLGLPNPLQQLLRTLAIAGHPTRLRHILQAAPDQMSPGDATISTRDMTRLRLENFVWATGFGQDDQIEIFHDRLRESIIAHLSEDELKSRNFRLASCFEVSGDVDADDIAGHYEAAGLDDKASNYYRQAAGEAISVLAFDRAEQFFEKATRLATTPEARVAIYEDMIHFFTNMARFQDAYEIGRRATELFGVSLPETFRTRLFAVDYAKTKLRLRNRSAMDLLALPEMTDPRLVAAVRVLNGVSKAAYQIRPELCVAVATKAVNLCLKHGNTPDCAIGYMVFGTIFQGGVLGNHSVGDQFGRLALALVDKYSMESKRAEVNFVVGYFGTSWMQPAINAEQLWQRSHEAGMRSGDLFHTGCALAAMTQSQWMRGVPLDELQKSIQLSLPFLDRVGLCEPASVIRSVRQSIANLRGETLNRLSFSDDAYDEVAVEAELAKFGSRHFAHCYFINKMLTLFLWGEMEHALIISRVSARYLKDSSGMLHGAEHQFLTTLVMICDAQQKGVQPDKAIKKMLRKFRKWARNCPANFQQRYQLLAAEWARLSGDSGAAMKFLKESIQSSGPDRNHWLEGVCHQRLSGLLSTVDPGQSDHHRQRASDCFRHWGATAYADDVLNDR